MKVKAYAKINLSLDVVGKREDGYHLLEMIMQNIELYDVIDINKFEEGIEISTNKSYIPNDSRNLAYKAADLFMKTYDISEGVKIDIIKNIPVAAGLAGGSSDAAAVLKAMRDLFCKHVSDEELMKLGLQLGADVPYCIQGGTALCEGIGEVVTPLNSFKNHTLVIIKPGFGVSTKEVYKNLDIKRIMRHPNTKLLLKCIEDDNLNLLSENMKNVLENVTLNMCPILRRIKRQTLKMGALGTLMSGSGPTIFAFFEDMLTAQRCYDFMKLRYKEVFITKTI